MHQVVASLRRIVTERTSLTIEYTEAILKSGKARLLGIRGGTTIG